MNIVVMGAGSLGGFYGALLARAGNDVTFVARGKTLEALRTNGLTVNSKLAGVFTIPVTATDDIASLSPPDLIFLSVKAYDLEAAAQAIAPLVGRHTTVLTVQNGIDHPRRIARHIEQPRIVPGVVYVSANVSEPGVIDQVGGPGRVLIGELAGPISARTESIRDVFSAAGIPTEIFDDIWTPLWEKFMAICAMSGVSALTRLTLQQIFNCTESRTLYRDIMAEVLSLARASSVDLPESAADDFLTMMLAMPELPLRGSMAYDLLAGRRLEVDTLNGTVVRMGEELGVPTPMNKAVFAALKPFAGGPPASRS
ncbi:2-dehydropantoate 2-reductase [soil metagenome]